jgi:hypothetical protein
MSVSTLITAAEAAVDVEDFKVSIDDKHAILSDVDFDVGDNVPEGGCV